MVKIVMAMSISNSVKPLLLRNLAILFNVNPASRGGHKADGVSKGEKRQLAPVVERGDSNPVFDIT